MKVNTLKAFTLVELLVAMIITGIVVGITYQVYIMANRQFNSYKSGNEKLSQIIVFKGLLHTDFFQSSSVSKSLEKGIEVVYSDKKILYEWNDKYLLRNDNGLRDTFFINIRSSEMKFHNFIQMKTNGLLDELVLVFEETGSEHSFCFFKKYSADVLMLSDNLENQ